MNAQETRSSDPALVHLPSLLPELEALYTDVHAHPELSMQETRTAGLAAERLRAACYNVTTAIGKTGVVGLLRNGAGPTVMLRADMDALPVEEATGLPYASKIKATDRDGKTVPVMHACGHDMHVAWLVGATTLLARARDTWQGTLMAVFQPAEETAEGAQAMIDDGLFDRFPKPDVVLGQHVMVGPAGTIGGRAGVVTSAGDSLQIRLFGRGAHGSMPQPGHACLWPRYACRLAGRRDDAAGALIFVAVVARRVDRYDDALQITRHVLRQAAGVLDGLEGPQRAVDLGLVDAFVKSCIVPTRQRPQFVKRLLWQIVRVVFWVDKGMRVDAGIIY